MSLVNYRTKMKNSIGSMYSFCLTYKAYLLNCFMEASIVTNITVVLLLTFNLCI